MFIIIIIIIVTYSPRSTEKNSTYKVSSSGKITRQYTAQIVALLKNEKAKNNNIKFISVKTQAL